MKTMEDYTNFCTIEQTIEAHKLGAPITRAYPYYHKNSKIIKIDNLRYYIPTTQQMIGWLKEKCIWVYVKRYWQYNSFYGCIETQGLRRIDCTDDFEKPEQAEFVAIDAALNYLEKNKL